MQLTEHGPDGKFAASGAAASAGMNVGFKAANHSSDDYKSVAAGHASNAAASASRTSHDNTQGSHVAAAAAHMAAARAHGEASLVTHGSDKTEHRDAQVAHEGAAKAHRDVAGPGAAHDDAVKKGDLSAQQGRGARDTSAVSGMAATASKGAGEATWKAGASGDAKDHKDAAQAHRDAASAHRDASTSAKQNSDSGQSHTSAAAAHKDAAAAHDMAAKARGSTLTALDVIEQLEITRDEKGQFSSAGGASEHVEAASHTAKSEGTREAHEAAAVAHSKAGDMHEAGFARQLVCAPRIPAGSPGHNAPKWHLPGKAHEAEGSHAKAEYHHEVAVDHATKDAPTRAEKSESTAKAAQEASTKAGSTGAAIDHQAAAVAHQAAFMANPNGPHADAHEHAAMEHSGKASAAIKAAGDGKAHERAIEAGRAAIPMASEHHDSAARGATGRAAALTENAHDSGSAADHKAAAEGHDDAAVAHEKAGQKDLAEGHTEAARAHHEAAEEARKGGKLTALATAAETHTAAAERSRLSVDLNTTITGGAPATNNSTEPADARAHTPEKLTMHKALAAYAAEKNLTKNQLVDRCKSAVPMALSESVTKALSDDEKDHPPPWLTKKIEGHLKALDDMEAGKKGEGDDDKPDSDRGEKMKALKAKADKAEEAKALMAQASAKEEEAKVLKAKALAVTGGPDPAPKNQIPLGASPLEQAVQGKLNSTSVGALTALGVAVGMNSADAEMHHDRVIRVALTSFEEQRELLTTFNVKSVKALRGKIEAMEDDAKAGKAASVQLAAIETERVHSAAAASVAQAEKEGRLTAEKKAKATGHLDAKRYEVLGAYLDACEPIAAFQNGAPSGGVTQLTVAQQDALRAAGAHPGAQGSEAPGKTEVGAPGTASKRSIEDMMNDPGVRESARALSILDNKPEFRAFCSALVDDAAGVTVTDRIATLSAHA